MGYEPVVVREDMLTIQFETKDLHLAAEILNATEFSNKILRFFIRCGLPTQAARMLRVRCRHEHQNRVDVYSAFTSYPQVMSALHRILAKRPIVVDGAVGTIMPACFCIKGCSAGTCSVTNPACAT